VRKAALAFRSGRRHLATGLGELRRIQTVEGISLVDVTGRVVGGWNIEARHPAKEIGDIVARRSIFDGTESAAEYSGVLVVGSDSGRRRRSSTTANGNVVRHEVVTVLISVASRLLMAIQNHGAAHVRKGALGKVLNNGVLRDRVHCNNAKKERGELGEQSLLQ